MLCCPICHLTVSKPRQAFLDNCFHLFCFKCIKEWSERQIDKGELHCPLCRRKYHSVFHNCILESFSRHWFLQHDESEEQDFNLTRDHAKRRALYFAEDRTSPKITKPVFPSLKRRDANDPEAQFWIKRELQALLLMSDVDVLTSVVVHLIRNHTNIVECVSRELEPFLDEHAQRFARELSSFLNSGLNSKGYDDFTRSGVTQM